MKPEASVERKPAIRIEETIFKSTQALAINSTAATASEIPEILKTSYADIMNFIKQNDVKLGKMVMCFYKGLQPPFEVEAAIEADCTSVKAPGRIYIKDIKPIKAVVAHYRGPYEQLEIAYNEIIKWINDNHKKMTGNMFEVYLNSPEMVSDSYDLLTDVYFPIE